MKLCVIGSGTWGTAATGLLAPKVDEVSLWCRSAAVAKSINAVHKNPRHLPAYTLAHNVFASASLQEVVVGASAMVLAVPSAYLRAVCTELAKLSENVLAPHLPILVLTKGIEPNTFLLMSEVVTQILGSDHPVACLSGPNHAEEISQGQFSAAVIAAQNEHVAKEFQELFASTYFRVYVSRDIRGVEVCAATKNVMAIACGLACGIGLGDNAQAVLMTRGLAEMGRIVCALQGEHITCMGLAGMGDLVATCTSVHSRNRSFGEALAKGISLTEYENQTQMVVEGARAVISCYHLGEKLGLDLPITKAVYQMLYQEVCLDKAMMELLNRPASQEFYS